jgi:divinyl chlorophyllide a 8-vinyl-reductase
MAAARAVKILLAGATGTIGRATARALVARGHDVICLARSDRGLPDGVTVRIGDVTQPGALDFLADAGCDAVISCLASRTGAPDDAWAIDHHANLNLLTAAKAASIGRFVLLSAICVQKPRLAFQHAKLAFEGELMRSGLDWTIVRPTAFFKSLSGQVERVRAGRPFLLFGDGRMTACKPISDDDLGAYLADCVTNEDTCGRVLPIGGPSPAITPREQGEALFALLGREARFRQVPVRLMDAIVAMLGLLPGMAAKAEMARIGRYYATESMLLLDPVTGRYDADATPETGQDRLFDHYARLLRGEAVDDRGAHAVF